MRPFTIESEQTTRRARVLAVVLLVVSGTFVVFGVREIGTRLILFPPSLGVVGGIGMIIASFRQERLLKRPEIQRAVVFFRGLLGMEFDQACSSLDQRGVCQNATTVRLADPRTWGVRQRRVVYEYGPFHVILQEKFTRVSRAQILIEDAQLG